MEFFSWYLDSLSGFRNWSSTHQGGANTSLPTAFREASGLRRRCHRRLVRDAVDVLDVTQCLRIVDTDDPEHGVHHVHDRLRSIEG